MSGKFACTFPRDDNCSFIHSTQLVKLSCGLDPRVKGTIQNETNGVTYKIKAETGAEDLAKEHASHQYRFHFYLL